MTRNAAAAGAAQAFVEQRRSRICRLLGRTPAPVGLGTEPLSPERLAYLRRDPRVSITVVGDSDWYHHVTLTGRVAELDEDALDDIDRISRHYTGQPYSQRDRRRVSAWIEVESWHSWAVSRPWATSD